MLWGSHHSCGYAEPRPAKGRPEPPNGGSGVSRVSGRPGAPHAGRREGVGAYRQNFNASSVDFSGVWCYTK